MLGQPYVECQGVTVPRRREEWDPQAGQGPRRLQWWARLVGALRVRMSTTPTILPKKIEERLIVGGFFVDLRPNGLWKCPEVSLAAERNDRVDLRRPPSG